MREEKVDDDFIVLKNAEEFEYHDDYNMRIRKKIQKQSSRFAKISRIEKENKVLRNRICVMESLCGFRNHTYITSSVQCIQKFVRGWILRKDKHIFDASVSQFLNECKSFLQRKKYLRIRKYIILIQSTFRGHICRKTPLCKSIMKNIEHLREINQLEFIVLRLSSVHEFHPTVYTNTIHFN